MIEKELKENFIFNWILKNKLAVGTSPIKSEHINLLKKKNIKNILGLCGENEIMWHPKLEKSFLCKRVFLPDSNQNKLPTNSQIIEAFRILKSFLEDGITFVHCFASIERSPLLCIMYVMEEYNLDLEEALDYVKEVHKFTNPRNNQLFFIKDFLKKSNLI